MAEFKEPKVEFINISTQQVVYASPTGAGGTMTCVGVPVANDCGNPMAATT